ncbi:MAG: VOC family protein [Alphaproteobacteria bacterium]|nr:VOC family protein [Alphaproteobacteria bacterium]
MPQIRHIALATNDPDRTAAFYKQAFGFREVARTKESNDPKQVAYGVYLSDGTLNMAILKFKNVDQLGRGLDYVGLHHFGIQVADDLEGWIKKLETLGADCFMRRPESLKDVFFETKFRGPDGVVFDVSEHPWGGTESIKEMAVERPRAQPVKVPAE